MLKRMLMQRVARVALVLAIGLRIAGLLLGACDLLADAPSADSPDELLARATAAYDAAMELTDRDQRLQRFAEAELLFRQIVVGGEGRPPVENAALLVNLGNAALQAERLGPAVVAYRRALLLEPAHSQARQNLQYARSLLPDWIRREDSVGIIDTLFFWKSLYSRATLLGFAAVCFLVAALAFAVSMARRRRVLRNLALLPLAAWLLLVVSVSFDADRESRQAAVVVTSELVVHAADSENSPTRLSTPLPSGAEVRVLSQRDRWTEIEAVPGRSGWVRTSGLERVEQGQPLFERL